MLYFKILMLTVATLSALFVFADGDKSQRGEFAKLMIITASLYLVGEYLEIAYRTMF